MSTQHDRQALADLAARIAAIHRLAGEEVHSREGRVEVVLDIPARTSRREDTAADALPAAADYRALSAMAARGVGRLTASGTARLGHTQMYRTRAELTELAEIYSEGARVIESIIEGDRWLDA